MTAETDTKLADALPCPFCGSTEVSVIEGSTFRWMVAQCDGCGAQAGEVRVQTLGDGAKEEWLAQGRIDAIAEWNKRTHDTARAQPASVADDLNEDAAWIRAFAIPSCERQTTRSGLEAIAKKLDLLAAPRPPAKESYR